jgi:hypothetical protein
MARMPKDFEVDGSKYTTTLFSATTGYEYWNKLLKMGLAPLVGFAVSGGMKADASIIPSIIESVMSRFDETHVVKFTKDLFETTKVIEDNGNRRPIVFDTDFAGRLMHMYKVLAEVLRYQYEDFFEEFAGVVGSFRQKVQPQSETAAGPRKNTIKAV